MKRNLCFVLVLLFAISCTTKKKSGMEAEREIVSKPEKKDSLRDRGEMKFKGRTYKNEIPPVKNKVENIQEIK